MDGPSIEKNIHQPFKGQKGFQALGLDIWDGPPADVQKYYANLTKLTYPILLNGSGVGAQYGVDRGTYMVVDPDGIIRYVSPGSLGHRYDETGIVTTIQTLLQRLAASAPLVSDFDGNGAVDFEDFFLFAAAFGGKDARFDLNQDGIVDLSDFFRFAEDFGKGKK